MFLNLKFNKKIYKSNSVNAFGHFYLFANYFQCMGSSFSQKQKRKMADQLNRSLGPEYLSVRPGTGSNKYTYVEGWLIISIANKIFGFDGWSSEIRSMVQEYNEVNDGKYSVGYSCCCRITLKNGIYKEDVGFGSSDNQRVRAMGIEKAKKEASTDALKRALRQFGNALGNCCYDKEFLRNVHKQGTNKSKSDDSNLFLNRKDLFRSNHSDEIEFSFNGDISDT